MNNSFVITLFVLPMAVCSLGAAAGCAPPGADAASSANAIEEDSARAPIALRVPVRFTRNDVTDVGHLFASSWVPFTDVRREPADGEAWARYSRDKAMKMAEWFTPDRLGAGYATAWFDVTIPYDKEGNPGYSLARVKLDAEYLSGEIAGTKLSAYSPLRVRRGSDQPCLSITMSGALEGKMKVVELPFTDEGFTERDWELGAVDGAGVAVKRVVVGSLNLSATCWPENVEGKTHATGGAGAGVGPVSGFFMFDQSAGQPGTSAAVIHMNLVENENGQVSVGETFSTNGGVLRERELGQFDEAARAAREKFLAGVKAEVERPAAETMGP